MHEVLVNRLGGLSLPRKSVVRLTDRPDMTLDVYRGRKTTIQQQQHQMDESIYRLRGVWFSSFLSFSLILMRNTNLSFANITDLHQMQCYAASDLDMLCLLIIMGI